MCLKHRRTNGPTGNGEGDFVWSLVSGINYIDGKIIRHETSAEELDYDPSEGRDWNWKDYESLGGR